MKKNYTVYLTWLMSGHRFVEAESKEEAERIALELGPPDNGEAGKRSMEVTDTDPD